MTAERQPQQLKERNEAVPYFTFDAIVVLGRGIEMNPATGKYVPTSLIEMGTGKYKAHTGIKTYNIDPDLKRTDAVIGGANSNVMACKHILEDWPAYGKPLPYVVFAAGRPKYLENAPEGISEGSVLKNKLVTSLRLKPGMNTPKMELQDQNKSTYDDIRESLKSCVNQGAKDVAIITVEPHVHRAWQFANLVMNENPEIADKLASVYFIDSWELLSKLSPEHYGKIFDYIKTTQAYRRTLRLEQGGRRALKRGVTSTAALVNPKTIQNLIV